MKRPDLLYEKVIEVDERIRVIGKWETNFGQSRLVFYCFFIMIQLFFAAAKGDLHQGTSGEWIEVLQAPQLDKLRPELEVRNSKQTHHWL